MRVAPKVELSKHERATLTTYSRGRSTPARLVLRSKLVLLAADGTRNEDIAKQLKTSRQTVGLWRTRFVAQRLAGIEQDAPRGGRRPRARPSIRGALAQGDAAHQSGILTKDC